MYHQKWADFAFGLRAEKTLCCGEMKAFGNSISLHNSPRQLEMQGAQNQLLVLGSFFAELSVKAFVLNPGRDILSSVAVALQV